MRDIQSGHRGVKIEIVYFEMRLVLEQHIMHLPETALQRGSFSGYSGKLGMPVFFHQRKMPVHEPELGDESPAQPADESMRCSTVGTFEIAVRDNSNGGVSTSHHMIIRQHNKIIWMKRPMSFSRHHAYAF